jgi:hypothetical protein
MAAALRFHPLFLITPLWFMGVLLYSSGMLRSRWSEFVLIMVAVLLAVMNIFRLVGILPGPG